MKWRTNINVSSELKMTYQDRFVFIGSCFAENMAHKMHRLGFQTRCNPLGIMYNPASLVQCLRLLSGQQELSKASMLARDGHYFHFDLHSDWHAKTMDALQAKVGQKVEDWQAFLKAEKQSSATINIVLTLGTAWVYRHHKTGNIVANCHKQETQQFSKFLLSEAEIMDQLKQINRIFSAAHCNIIWTVSPIRHLKDGVSENAVSKSRLISAVYEMVQQHKHMHYFPAYEIMMDELRDYRYYQEDLIHPTETAISYIWTCFKEATFGIATQETMDKCDKILKMKDHRLLFPESEEAQRFKQKLKDSKEQFHKDHPEVRINE